MTASEDRLAPIQALTHSVGTSRWSAALPISHGMQVARVYNSPTDSDAEVATNTEIAALLDRGISVVASHKTTDAGVVQDRATFLASFTLAPGQFIADGYYHEPDNDGLDAGEITAWFDRQVTFAGITHTTAPDVLWHCTFTGSPGFQDDLVFDFLPPDVDYPWLDFLGVDRYVQNVNNRTPTQAWEAIRDTAVTRYGRPLGILEMAVAGTVAQRSQWVEDHAAYIAAHSPDVLMSLWFHSDVGENAPLTYDGSNTWAFDHAANAYDPDTPYAWQTFADTYSRYSTDIVPVLGSLDDTGAVDVTDDLAAWLNGLADGTTVEFGTGIFRIDGTVTITDRNALTLTMEPTGYFIRDDPTGSGFLPMFNPVGGCNLTLDGLRVRGANRNAGVDGDYVVAKESQHCVILSGTTNTEIVGCEFWEPYGDCLYLGRRKIGPAGARDSFFWCNTISVTQTRLHHSGRQLLTTQGAMNVDVDDCDLWEARRSTWEIEPNILSFNGVDTVAMHDCRIGRGRFGIIANAGSGPCDNVTFEDNHLARSIAVLGIDGAGGRRKNWRIANNRFVTPETASVWVPVLETCAHVGNPSGCAINMTGYDGVTITGNEVLLDTGRTPSMVLAQLTDCTDYSVSGNDVWEVIGGDGPSQCDVVGPGDQTRTTDPPTPTATATTLESSGNPSAPGDEVAFTATVTPVPEGGTVMFTVDGVPVEGFDEVPVNDDGTAVCTVTFDEGSHTVVAAYSGDGTFAGSESLPIVQEVFEDIGPPLPGPWTPESTWAYDIAFAMLEAAVSCEAVCDRRWVSDGGLVEQPPPGCNCQLVAVIREGPNGLTPKAICGSGRFAEIRLLLDLCVELPGKDEIPDPVAVNTRAQANASTRWLMMQGLMAAASSGLLTVLDGPAIFGPTWAVTVDGWRPTRTIGGMGRWESVWTFSDQG